MALSQTKQAELKELFGGQVAFGVPLSQHTSIRIGGPADAMLWPNDLEQLQAALHFARSHGIPYYILGKGSNTLVRDTGFRGVVISLSHGFRHFEKAPPPVGGQDARFAGTTGGGEAKENGQSVLVLVEGGVPTQQLVRWAALEGLSGLERLAGVPGTIGGNVFMNAGTYLGEIGELVEAVTFCDRQGGLKTLAREKLKFEYRNTNIPTSSVIVRALLKLGRGEKEKIEAKIREVFEKRGLAQPIEVPNLGSVFKNPGPPSGRQKKAWELIEEAGCKGVRVGGARISDKHANFIINEGGATAKDVEILIRMVKDRVKQVTGEALETEIKIIGEES